MSMPDDAFDKWLGERRDVVLPAFESEFLKVVEMQLEEEYGPRCPDVEPGCPCCDAWTEYDKWVNGS